VKVTVAPEHTGLTSAAIVTLTGSNGLTVMVTGAEVAGLPVAQIEFEVRSTVTTSPVTGMYEYVAALTPALTPLTFHW